MRWVEMFALVGHVTAEERATFNCSVALLHEGSLGFAVPRRRSLRQALDEGRARAAHDLGIASLGVECAWPLGPTRTGAA